MNNKDEEIKILVETTDTENKNNVEKITKKMEEICISENSATRLQNITVENIVCELEKIWKKCNNVVFIVDYYIKNNIKYVEFLRIKNTEKEIYKLFDQTKELTELLHIEWDSVNIKGRRMFYKQIDNEMPMSIQLGILKNKAIDLKQIIDSIMLLIPNNTV